MDAKTKEILTSENKSFFGFTLTDLMGIALMLIPVIISLVKYESDERLIPFLSWPTYSGERGLMPDLTWIGLWVIAAYSWVIFIIAAVASWEAVARAMGGFGALFMITFGISMILQIQGHVDLNDFSLGFRRCSSHAESQNIVVNATTAYISKDVISGTGNHTMHNLEIEKAYSEIDN